MTALWGCIMGIQRTAPVMANRKAERAQFIIDHPGWTFEDYDKARGGDITFLRDYEKMIRAAEDKALREAQEKQKPHG